MPAEFRIHSSNNDGNNYAKKPHNYILSDARAVLFEYDSKLNKYSYFPLCDEYIYEKFDYRGLYDMLITSEIVHKEDLPILKEAIDMIEKGDFVNVDVRLLCKDGTTYRWHNILSNGFENEYYENSKTVGVILDEQNKIEYSKMLKYLSEYDTLTGIYNRAGFLSECDKRLRKEPDKYWKMVVFDLDRFKTLNDIYGIEEGDKLIYYISKIISIRMNDDEICSHMRDDVFCMLLNRSDDDTVKLIEELDSELLKYPLSFKFVSSSGIYDIKKYGQYNSVSVLCDRAVMAQKKVKGSFVLRYAFYNENMAKEVLYEQELASYVNDALNDGQFVVYLQPQYDMLNDKVIGAEALVRWIHPEKGVIPPSEFIPMFEKNGFILKLDEYIWESVCRTIKKWKDTGTEPVPVSVNISGAHIHDPDICKKFIGLIEKYNLEPRLLELELTESGYVENPPALSKIMEELQNKGFVFLMDDFGSGYSSLNLLRNIPVNVIKIDLNFLGYSDHEVSGKIILESVIHMAKRLNLPVIAEGVETKEQSEFLINAGCIHAQGYYYARPMPINEFETRFLA